MILLLLLFATVPILQKEILAQEVIGNEIISNNNKNPVMITIFDLNFLISFCKIPYQKIC